MKKKADIAAEVSATLDSLRGASRAMPGDFFFTRVQGRLQQPSSGWGYLGNIMARPLIAVPALILILLLNGWILAKQFSSNKGATVAVEQGAMQAFADEYNLQVTTFYDGEKQ
ncbi:hypothetical protein KTO58_17070 [Chitinophaga pendula]|uniref:hypothetical protein n=1 Tax=Chitinophaga TaxID=79328 RepID=UPI000BB02E05|nr:MULTISPECIES: hypothetical protein [Chitinophaga]ASZ11588.1 hypothetical protein CK934_11775 [Chitinophaga sp. MD30]UCJ05402.1 hypothetical protein KTO58_17070 [Chitinophaga pendula]